MRRPPDRARRPRPVSGRCAACGGRAARAPPRRAQAPRARASWPPPPRYGSAPADLVRCAALRPHAGGRVPGRGRAGGGLRRGRRRAPTSTRRPASAPPRRARSSAIERHAGRGRARATSAAGSASCCRRPSGGAGRRRGVEPSRVRGGVRARAPRPATCRPATLEAAELPDGELRRGGDGRRDRAPARPRRGARPRSHGLLRPGGRALPRRSPTPAAGWRGVLGARWWSVLPTHVQYFTRAQPRARCSSRHGFARRVDGHRAEGLHRALLPRAPGGLLAAAGARRRSRPAGRSAWPTAWCGPTSATAWRSWPGGASA